MNLWQNYYMSGLVTYLIYVFLILIPLGLFIESKYGIKSVSLDELETLWQLPDLKIFVFISCFCISWMLLNITLTIFKIIFSEKYEELYKNFVGDVVSLSLFSKVNNLRKLKGTLLEVLDSEISVKTEGETLLLELSNIEVCKLDLDDQIEKKKNE